MGFRINTNIAAMTAHTSAVMNNRNLDESLSKLSSGLRINKAADDASGMVIANSLRNQANSLGQAIANGNDGIGMIQTADGALNEYAKILDTIKTKAVQAGSDTQNTASRLAIQKDIDRLMEELSMIARTTSFNGQKLLSGSFTNKQIQMGSGSNETVKFSVASAETNQIGHTSRAVMNVGTEMGGEVQLNITSALTGKNITLKPIDLQYNNNAENGMGAVANEINKYSGETGIKAKAIVETTSNSAVTAGSTGSDFAINGITIGAINVTTNDNSGTLVSAINGKTSQTGVSATISTDGKLTLKSNDGRAIEVTGDMMGVVGVTGKQMSTLGKIELIQSGSGEFQITGNGAGATGADITISSAVTTSEDSVLKAGSTIKSATTFVAGSTIGGNIQNNVATTLTINGTLARGQFLTVVQHWKREL
jgi:flagellin